MPEENQIQMNQTSTPTNDIRERLSWLRSFREGAVLRKAKQTQNTLDMDSNNLYEQSLNVNNKNLSEKYNQASQSAAAASMIKSYAERNGDDWSDLNTPQEILTEYLTINDDDNTYNRLMDFVKSSQDPEEFWLEMWWIEKDWWDKLWDFAKNTGQNFLSFFESWWEAVRNLVNWWIWALEWDQTPWALENYAKMNYWKDFYSLSETEKAEAREAVSSKEWLDMYKPTAQRITLKWWEAWLDALFTAFAPWIKAWFSVAWAWAEADVPVVSDVLWWALWWLDKVNGFIWWIVTEVPWLSDFRDSLQTEQEKKEFDNFLWMIVLWKIMQKRWGRIKNSRSLKETVINELDPRVTIEEFQKRVTEAPADVKEWINRARDWKATQENLQEQAWKIVKTKTVEETETATRALQDADVAWAKNYKELNDRLINRWKEIEALEDAEYAKTDDIKFKPEDTKYTKEYEQDWYKTTREINSVQEWIDLLKDFYEWNPDKSASLELLEAKFKNEWLNKREINNISRAIAQEYETYKARWQEKTSIKSKDVEDIRRAVKNFAREWNERLVELDKQWSDNMNTRAMIKDVQNEIVRAKNNLANKNILQKTAWTLWKIFNAIWWTEALSKAWLKWLIGNDWLDPITRQNKLKSNLNRFNRLNERLNWAKNKTEVKEIVKEFNEEFEKANWPVEWEVIEETKSGNGYDNTYLEDKVQVSPK